MNVRLRPYRYDDASAIVEAVLESMTELRPWMPWCHPAYSIDESRSWLGLQIPAFDQKTSFEFAIVAADGAYLGGCGLNQLDSVNRRAPISAIGYDRP